MPLTDANTSRFTFTTDTAEFLVTRFRAIETVSKPYWVQLSLASEEDIALDDIIGTEGVLWIAGKEDRYFHGVINEFYQAAQVGRFYLYQAQLVPSLWLLSLRQECRIFQNMNTPDIVKEVLTGTNIFQDRVIFRLRGNYAPREYCVQYRETDLQFISRLLEQEGIFYFFGHSEDKHLLIFGDDAEICRPISPEPELQYHITDLMVADEEVISSFDAGRRLHSDNITLTDYFYEKPDLNLASNHSAPEGLGFNVFDCPGIFLDTDIGRRRAKTQFEEAARLGRHAKGRSNCAYLVPGHTFKLAAHDRQELNGKYMLVQIRHKGEQPQVLQEFAGGGEGPSYNNNFTTISASVTYRPPCQTPKPRISGPQSAVVMGPEGEEIYTDKMGRIKVKFFWDHATESDGSPIANEKRTCWIRVVQSSAGPGWGALFLPRVGHEVIVEFMEGDPDRPIVTGQVYHGTHNPPYDLPAEKTKSTIKTNSSPDGKGFNEIRFEDKKDKEQLFMHAQKDFDLRVLNDRALWIGNDNHTMIARDKLDQIDGDKHLTVSGDHNEKVGGTISIESGSDLQTKVSNNHALDAGMEIHLKAGMKVVIEAGTQVSLKAGGSFVDIGPAGVSITGAMVNINSGGSAGSGSGASPDTPKTPREADNAQAGETAKLEIMEIEVQLSPQAAALKEASKSGAAFCET